jgi:hypothetical protein
MFSKSVNNINTYQDASDAENRIGRLLGCVVEGILVVRGGGIGTNVETEALDCGTFVACAKESAIESRVRRREDEIEGR